MEFSSREQVDWLHMTLAERHARFAPLVNPAYWGGHQFDDCPVEDGHVGRHVLMDAPEQFRGVSHHVRTFLEAGGGQVPLMEFTHGQTFDAAAQPAGTIFRVSYERLLYIGGTAAAARMHTELLTAVAAQPDVCYNRPNPDEKRDERLHPFWHVADTVWAVARPHKGQTIVQMSTLRALDKALDVPVEIGRAYHHRNSFVRIGRVAVCRYGPAPKRRRLRIWTFGSPFARPAET